MVQMVRDYGNQTNWNVGGLFVHDRFIHIFVDTLDKLGYKNPINSVSGTIMCVMAGSSVSKNKYTVGEVNSIIDEYNNRGIDCRLDFSNVFVEEESFNDEVCNAILNHLDCNNVEGHSNGVIVSDPRYADYVRSNYSEIQVIASYMKPMFEVGLGNDNVEYYNKLLEDFDYVEVNPYYVIDSKFLEGLDNKDKVIFTVNSRELPNDPLTKEYNAALMVEILKSIAEEDCSKESEKIREIVKSQNEVKNMYPLAGTNLSHSDIENLLRMGFKNFSLSSTDCNTTTYLRDIGEYLCISYLFNRLSQAIMQSYV